MYCRKVELVHEKKLLIPPSPKFASLQGILLEESDGAPWIEGIAVDGFKGAIFMLDCSHAFGYVNSAYELETQLVLAVDLGLCDDARSRPVVGFLQEVIRVLQGLIVALERRIEG